MDLKKAFDEGRFFDIVSAAPSPSSPEEKLILGISLYKLGRDEEALSVFDEIAREAEKMMKALYYQGLIYRQQGDLERAKHCLSRYALFYPDDDEAQDILDAPEEEGSLLSEPSVELAKIYAMQGHYEEALDIYARVQQTAALAPDVRKEALGVQDIYILKTLETWLKRLKK